MNRKALLLSLICIALIHPFSVRSQAANTGDSLALVDLYNSTNGPGWTNHTNWLTTAPLSTWYGVTLQNGRLQFLDLPTNNLVGTIPSSLGNTQLWSFSLAYNQLVGSIPSSFNNLTQCSWFDFSHNQLSGMIPAFSGSPNLTFFNFSYNNFTFSSFSAFPLSAPYNTTLSPQADLPLITNGNTLSIATGGTLAHNTYTWYQDGNLLTTKNGDSTLAITTSGNYNVSVTSTDVTGLTLYSIGNTNTRDSLALVDLYNSTNGASWVNHSNWLTAAPAATWYGVTVRNQRVTALQLYKNNLAGPIPASLGNLSGLLTLSISGGSLSGAIPSSLGNLSSLTGLSLSYNQLTGAIPAGIGNLSHLTGINLRGNQLSDTIPASIGNLTALTGLSLSQNQLTGRIPSSIGNLSNLNGLSLDNNQLSGGLPASLGNLTHLDVIYLNNNQFSDTLPASLGRLTVLQQFYANNNQLTGSIPDSFSNMVKLGRLALSNNKLTGKIPDSLGKPYTSGSYTYYNLFDIELQNNQLSGPVPSLWSHFTNVATFRIDSNRFTFAGMETLPHVFYTDRYAPQANIPLLRKQNTFYVQAGGTLANNTFQLYKDGTLVATQTGDSAFTITQLAKYNIVTTNSIATQLTLYSDTLGQNLVLPDSSISGTQSISGNTSTDITTGIFKLATLTPAATANGLSGPVTTLETIDDTVTTYNGLPYVQRHYDITPSDNAATAQATVTLYFTQQDFDAYNSYIASKNLNLPLLPSNGIDNGNLRITQYHGSFTGIAAPANYSGGVELITPTVSWDATNSWWAVSFPVTGFSGFFLSTGVVPLPLTLLQFTGVRQGMTVHLQWQTTNEKNTRQFIIQRSSDGAGFTTVGTQPAKSTAGLNDYTFSDGAPLAGNNFYRLKMADADGSFTYSPIVVVAFVAPESTLSAWPNPAHGIVTISFTAANAGRYTLLITDPSGKTIAQKLLAATPGLNRPSIDLGSYAPGIYTITLINEEKQIQSLKINRQ